MGRGGTALGDGDVACRPVGRRHLADDDPDVLERRVDGLDDGPGQCGDEGAHLLGRAALHHGHLDEWHGPQPSPPLRKTDPRWVKWHAVLDPGGAKTASVMPPVRTIHPASMAWPRRARSLAARASASPGCPCTAAPVAESTTAPPTSTRTASRARSSSAGGSPTGPVTKAPDEALSAATSPAVNRKSW